MLFRSKGKLDATDIIAEDKQNALKLAATAEKWSEHPIGQAIVKKAEANGINIPDPEAFEALPGFGVTAKADGKRVLIGNRALMQANKVSVTHLESEIERLENEGKTVLILAVEGKATGAIAVSDTVKEHSREAITTLQKMG